MFSFSPEFIMCLLFDFPFYYFTQLFVFELFYFIFNCTAKVLEAWDLKSAFVLTLCIMASAHGISQFLQPALPSNPAKTRDHCYH